MKKIIVVVLCVVIVVAATTVTAFAATAATTETTTTNLVPVVEKTDAIISEKATAHPISGDYIYYKLYCPMCVYVSEDFYASVNI